MSLNELGSKVGKYTNNTKFLVILLVVILFVIAALYTYRRYISEGFSNANNEFKSDESPVENADVYYFFTTWCPHCKTATPEWNAFKDEMKDKTVNGVKLNFFQIDCDADKATADKFNVQGFPTIKLVKGNKIIDYEAKPSKATLIEFVTTML
jgi:thiol-disulfide isomerase/thioredoxin